MFAIAVTVIPISSLNTAGAALTQAAGNPCSNQKIPPRDCRKTLGKLSEVELPLLSQTSRHLSAPTGASTFSTLGLPPPCSSTIKQKTPFEPLLAVSREPLKQYLHQYFWQFSVYCTAVGLLCLGNECYDYYEYCYPIQSQMIFLLKNSRAFIK